MISFLSNTADVSTVSSYSYDQRNNTVCDDDRGEGFMLVVYRAEKGKNRQREDK